MVEIVWKRIRNIRGFYKNLNKRGIPTNGMPSERLNDNIAKR